MYTQTGLDRCDNFSVVVSGNQYYDELYSSQTFIP